MFFRWVETTNQKCRVLAFSLRGATNEWHSHGIPGWEVRRQTHLRDPEGSWSRRSHGTVGLEKSRLWSHGVPELLEKNIWKYVLITMCYLWYLMIIMYVEEETIGRTSAVHLDSLRTGGQKLWWERTRFISIPPSSMVQVIKRLASQVFQRSRSRISSHFPNLSNFDETCMTCGCRLQLELLLNCSMNTPGRSIPYSMTFIAALLTCMSLRCKQARIMLKRSDNARHKSFCSSSGFLVFMSWEQLQLNLVNISF